MGARGVLSMACEYAEDSLQCQGSVLELTCAPARLMLSAMYHLTILWLIIAVLAGVAGYVAGRKHGRRLVRPVNRADSMVSSFRDGGL
jgi:hypothetical protein